MTDETGTRDHPGRVFLWMLPRTVSTAFTRCIGGIPQCEVWMEPYTYCGYAGQCLLNEDGEKLHPEFEGNEDVYIRAAAKLKTRKQIHFPPERLSISNVRSSLESSTSKYVFVKDESIYVATDEQRSFLPKGYQHAFIIREPTLVFDSFHKAKYSVLSKANLLPEGIDEKSFDLRKHDPIIPPERFYELHHSLWKYIRENIDPDTIVIDASEVLSKPAEMLPRFCEAMGLPYSDSLLEWDQNGIESTKSWKWPSDQLVHDDSYLKISMTTGKFLPPRQPPSRDQLTDDVIVLAEKARPFYQEMFESRLRL